MIPLGILGQVYVACAAIGVGFVGLNFVIGQLDDVSMDYVGGAGHGLLGDGGTGGHDFGAGSGGSSGHDFGTGDSSSGHDFGAGDDSGAGGSNLALQGHASVGHTVSTPITVVPARHGNGNQVILFVLGLLSPMTIALNLAFFGLSGLFFGYLAPWLGIVTIVPALCVMFVMTNAFKAIVRWMLRQMNVSSHAKSGDAVGQMAEVNTPIEEGHTGEVTYIIGSKRYSSAAKPAKQGMKFGRGDRVMIVDVNGHMVFVEPWKDLELDDRVAIHKSA